MLLLLVIVRTSTTAKKINMDGTNHVPLKNDGEQQPNAPKTLFLPLTQKAHPWAQLNKTMPQCSICLSVIPSFRDHSCPSDATPRTDAFCAALKGIGNWERWQKTASFAADLERELATVRRDLRGLMDEYADRREAALNAAAKEQPKARRSAAACSPSSLTPETDDMGSMRRTVTEWRNLCEKLERERNALRCEVVTLTVALKDIIAGNHGAMVRARKILSENAKSPSVGATE
jgi:hypothetical protein